MREVTMPASGMAMTEGLLVQWLKKPGDPVRQGEPIAEIETDKATLEMESPASGRMGQYLFEQGSMVPVGVAIAHILEDGDEGPAPDPDAPPAEVPRPAAGDASPTRVPAGPAATTTGPSSSPSSSRASGNGATGEVQTRPAQVPTGVVAGTDIPAETSPVLEDTPAGAQGTHPQPAAPASPGRAHDAPTADTIDELRRRMIPHPPPLSPQQSNGASPGATQDPRGGGTLTPSALSQGEGYADTPVPPSPATAVAESEAAELLPIDVTGLEAQNLVAWLEAMVLIRVFEEAADPLATAGKIPGGMHSAAGQEAVAVGVMRALAPTDIITSTHRSHHHSLAKGLTPRSIMAELYGKVTGCLGGRAGHMHLADFSIGLFGSNGIVGAGLGLAMGAALAAQMRRVDQVAVGFFGDGGANTGRVWENINLATLWRLPLIVVCENNLYAVETYVHRAMSSPSIAERAAGFGLPCITVDGQDVVAVYHAVSEARARAVGGGGPSFVEAQTYRYEGHNTGDVGNYREQEEVERWRRTRDPLLRLQRALEEAGLLAAGQYDAIVAAARATVEDAVRFAEESPWPDPSTALDNVFGLPLSEENR